LVASALAVPEAGASAAVGSAVAGEDVLPVVERVATWLGEVEGNPAAQMEVVIEQTAKIEAQAWQQIAEILQEGAAAKGGAGVSIGGG
jgi:hypothetical protein